jgi:hypothetical protein
MSRSFSWRAVLPVVIGAPLIGVIGAQLVVGSSSAATPARHFPVSRSASGSVARPYAASSDAGTAASVAQVGGTADGVSLAVGADGPPAFIADPTTEAQVAQDLIAAVDAQSKGVYAIAATPDNITLVESWMANEGGLWADNPLNTSLDAGRYRHEITTSGDNTGIPIFPDIEIGVNATATTLLNNHAYAGILDVLRQGNASCSAFARAVIDSPWAASHYGHDPGRFCGAAVGGATVPGTTGCLQVPNHGKRGALRSHAPGGCGRFAGHSPSGRSARPAAHHHTAHRAATSHATVSRTAGHRPGGGRR